MKSNARYPILIVEDNDDDFEMIMWALKKLSIAMPVFFVSGYQANQISHNFVLDEGLNFLPKPFDLDELAAKVREVLT